MVLSSLLYYSLLKYIVGLGCFIPVWVFIVLGWQLFGYEGNSQIEHEWKLLELVWTVVPSLLMGMVGYYSVSSYVLKGYRGVTSVYSIVGSQWYWSYKDGSNVYDSMMSDFMGSVDKPARLEVGNVYRLLMTSEDVIHSFSVPDLGMKIDGMPGRVNSILFMPHRVGKFVGYCSELCGASHAYMPMVVEMVKKVK